MNEYTIKDLEKLLGLNIKHNAVVMGFDTASRTGWCRIETDEDICSIDYGVVDIESKDMYYKFNRFIEVVGDLVFKQPDIVVIEETFLKLNARVFQFLSRLGGILYAVCYLNKVSNIYFLSAIAARAKLNLPSKAKKEEVHKEFLKRFKKIKIKDIDVIDAIILALCGISENAKLIKD
jgi:Holliday junction resolvasome RuvABC endonuclease subunit